MNKFLENPWRIINFLAAKRLLNGIPDKQYLQMRYAATFARKLNLDDPKYYSEKLQWLKLYDRKPEYTTIVDKYEAKKYTADLIGEKYIIPTLGVWDSAEDIDFDKLPDRFVLKCTHNSGNGMCICKDKSKLDIAKVKDDLAKGMKENYYQYCREWPYKNVKPRIIAEEYIGTDSNLPNDYKFFTFNGEIDSVMVCKGRETGHPWFYFYDMQWNRKYYQYSHLEKGDEIEKPKNLDEMIEIVNKLCKGYKHIRVDLYNEAGKIYFGELTLYNHSGFDPDILPETDLMFGEKILLND